MVALLTDFGLQDHYVSVMKGVMLGICPDTQFIDITHEIPPQSIAGGMLALEASLPYFPDGTVFLCVVDPGVGSSRRALAVRTDRHWFVGPDNGLLTPAMANCASCEIVELMNTRYQLPVRSATFEGRDRFAPAAAWLAAGVPLANFGPPVEDPILQPLPVAHRVGASLEGEVIAVDRFGNLVTSIEGAQLPEGVLTVTLANVDVATVVVTYADVAVDTPCALVGSSGRLEIAVRNGNAAARFGAGVGMSVLVRAGA